MIYRAKDLQRYVKAKGVPSYGYIELDDPSVFLRFFFMWGNGGTMRSSSWWGYLECQRNGTSPPFCLDLPESAVVHKASMWFLHEGSLIARFHCSAPCPRNRETSMFLRLNIFIWDDVKSASAFIPCHGIQDVRKHPSYQSILVK